MSTVESATSATAVAPKNTAHKEKKKTWREIHRERKDQRKMYREQNLARKLEKQKKREETEKKRQEDEAQDKTPPKVSTLSIAVPGSILENAQSQELRTYLAGQIARAACIFKVDEVIVFDDLGTAEGPHSKKAKINLTNGRNDNEDNDEGITETIHSCCLQLARILQYLECPQYLRKSFFPIHKDLKFSGLLNPLDAPHHLRQQNDFIFREGVVSGKPPKQTKGSYVNIGLLNECLVDKILTPGLRVTVKLEPNQDLRGRKIRGKIVSPSTPRAETGVYWGYSVRLARSFSDIFGKSPYPDGYDLTIGTSDKGDNVHSIERESLPFDHALIVFGGLQGIDAALEADEKLAADDPSLLFDQYVNSVPNQGSRTIRTEEAILISLAVMEEKLIPNQRPKEFDFQHAIPQSEDTGVKQLAYLQNGDSRKRKQSDPSEAHQAAKDSRENEINLSKFD